MLAGGIGWFLFYSSSRNTDWYPCSIVFETKMRMKKKILSPFLYTAKKKLIKENLHFAISSPETTTHLERITGKKKFLRKKSHSIPKTSLPKMKVLGYFISNF